MGGGERSSQFNIATTKSASIPCGLLTLPNFYHKGLAELIQDSHAKQENGDKNREEFLETQVVSKMTQEMIKVDEVNQKHKNMMREHMLMGLQNKCDLI